MEHKTSTKRHTKRKAKGDSFAKRRNLFKNVWDAALDMEDKERDSGTKPKVIKTLRLTEMDNINIGKNKKQRIKYLRNVCTRLLDFCNHHDAEETYELMHAGKSGNAGIEDSNDASDNVLHAPESPKAKKMRRKKKRIPRANTYVTLPIGQPRQNQFRPSFGSTDEGHIKHRGTKPLRDLSTPRLDRSTLIKQYAEERHNLENALVPYTPDIPENDQVGDVPRKVVKKKHRRRIKPTIKPLPTKVSNQTKTSSMITSKRKSIAARSVKSSLTRTKSP